MTTPTIRIMLADDHPLFRAGVQALLEEQPDFEVIASVSDGIEALTRAREHEPDVLLLDIELPGLSGVSVAQELLRRRIRTRILVLSAFDDEAYIADLLAKGIAGYLTKDEAGRVVVDAVRHVARGQDGWMSQSVRSKLMKLHQPQAQDPLLSHRELDVLKLLAGGQSNKEIAAQLHISAHTVRNHLSNIYRKLEVGSRMEALLKVQQGELGHLLGALDAHQPAEVMAGAGSSLERRHSRPQGTDCMVDPRLRPDDRESKRLSDQAQN